MDMIRCCGVDGQGLADEYLIRGRELDFKFYHVHALKHAARLNLHFSSRSSDPAFLNLQNAMACKLLNPVTFYHCQVGHESLKYLQQHLPTFPAPVPHGVVRLGRFCLLFTGFMPGLGLEKTWSRLDAASLVLFGGQSGGGQKMSFRLLIRASALMIAIAGVGPQAAEAGETINYTYDSLGRLVAAKSTGTVNSGEVASYCYDGAGNRIFAETVDTGIMVDCSSVPAPPLPPPPPPAISIGDRLAIEGGTVTFYVTMNAAYDQSVSVDYATAPASAHTNDFYMKSGSVTFSPGQTSKSIAVATREDSEDESRESFSMNLSNPTGGTTIYDGHARGWIEDDDTAGGGCPLC